MQHDRAYMRSEVQLTRQINQTQAFILSRSVSELQLLQMADDCCLKNCGSLNCTVIQNVARLHIRLKLEFIPEFSTLVTIEKYDKLLFQLFCL